MVFFNYALRKLNAKIVYYGPGLCGKTTNLQWIHDHFEGGQRGKMISLATEGDRTIFFDLLPIDIGTIRGMDVTLQLYTVPGQVHYNSTRQLVLRGADGVVFVADSQRTMKSSNMESFENLKENLMLQGIDIKDFPHVLQFNKRDLKDLLSPEELNEDLNTFSVPIFEGVATDGIGVQETLEGIVKLVMRNLREKYEPIASASGPKAPAPMRAQTPAPVTPAAPAAPVAAKSDPLAPDFVSEEEAPQAPQPPQAPPSFEAPADPAPAATEAVSTEPDIGFSGFNEEDEIATKVYEEAEDEIAGFEQSMENLLPSTDEAVSFGEEIADQAEGGQDLFTDPRDEDAPSPAEVASEFDPGVPAEDAIADDFTASGFAADNVTADEPDAEPAGDFDLSTDPEIEEPEPETETPSESMDDLFEAEPPSVKDYVNDVINGPDPMAGPGPGVVAETEAETVAEESEEETVIAPSTDERYEDRIEAPGPFAPSASADEKTEDDTPEVEVAAEEPEPDAPSIEDQVLQAFGASENREALASLSVDEPEPEPEPATTGFLDDPPEVQPVVPPEDEPVDEPVAAEAAEEAIPAEEPVSDEPVVFDQIVVEAPVVEEVEAEPEPVVEPEVEEPPAEEEPAVVVPAVETPPEDDIHAKSQPIMVGTGDPFAAEEGPATTEVIPHEDDVLVPSSSAIDVSAQDNQLHLQLKGSGAIAEMGQVRALDIEVPVPGQWVGNRKVTLQLRLTLTPAEDEDE